MKRILNLLAQDFRLMFRDSIVLYIAFGPVLMAVALRFFLPSVEDVNLRFAVHEEIGAEAMERIGRYADIELFDDTRALTRRVERSDMVPGIMSENGRITLLFEGNEAESLIRNSTDVLSRAISDRDPISVRSERIGTGSTFIIEIVTVLIIMTTLFLGGVASGFLIVDEKDSKAIRGLAVSPLGLCEFAAARGLMAFVIGTVVATINSFILASDTVEYVKLLSVFLASFPLGAFVGLVIGRLANNQINAISAIKICMPVFLTVPLASLFIPRGFRFLTYPFPNYWQFTALRSVFAGDVSGPGILLSSIGIFVPGIAFLAVLAAFSKRHFGFR